MRVPIYLQKAVQQHVLLSSIYFNSINACYGIPAAIMTIKWQTKFHLLPMSFWANAWRRTRTSVGFNWIEMVSVSEKDRMGQGWMDIFCIEFCCHISCQHLVHINLSFGESLAIFVANATHAHDEQPEVSLSKIDAIYPNCHVLIMVRMALWVLWDVVSWKTERKHTHTLKMLQNLR